MIYFKRCDQVCFMDLFLIILTQVKISYQYKRRYFKHKIIKFDYVSYKSDTFITNLGNIKEQDS